MLEMTYKEQKAHKPQNALHPLLQPLLPILARLDRSSLPPGYGDTLYRGPTFPLEMRQYKLEDNEGLRLPPIMRNTPAMGISVLLGAKDSISHEKTSKPICLMETSFLIPEITEERIRPTQDVIFMLDVSSSMGSGRQPQSKLSTAKSAVAKLMSESLEEGDFVSIYTFDDHAKTIFEHCPVSEFKNERSKECLAFKAIAKGAGTYIGSAFTQFLMSSAIPTNTSNVITIFLLTDGQDGSGNKTNVAKIVKGLKEKYPDKEIRVIPIGIGEDYDPSIVGAFSTLTPTGLSTNIHIVDSNDMDKKFNFISRFLQPRTPLVPVKLTAQVADHAPVPLDLSSVQPGEEYSCLLEIAADPDKVALPVKFTCQYLNDPAIKFEYHSTMIVNNYQYNSDLLDSYIRKRTNEILQTPEVGRVFSCTRRLLYQESASQEDFKKVREYFIELTHLYDLLAEQPSGDHSETVNALSGALCNLSVCYFKHDDNNELQQAAETIPALSSFIKQRRHGGASTNITQTTNTFRMGACLSNDARKTYQCGERTAAMRSQLNGLSKESEQVEEIEGHFFVKMQTGSHRVIDSKYNFGKFPHNFKTAAGLISLDGGLTNREGIKLGGVEINHFRDIVSSISMDSSLPTESKVDQWVKLTQEMIRQPKPSVETASLTEQALLDLICFNATENDSVKLESSKEIQCIDLNQFLNLGLGYCRHSVLALAICMGTAANEGKLPKGKINIFRYTAYNQQAHSWVMYEPSGTKELYLIDPTLPEGQNRFNLKDQKQLIAAIKAYNSIGLNGILNDVIKRKGLGELLKGSEYLLDIKSFNPAVVEQFDEDAEFKCYLSALSNKLPTSPIRLRLKNMLTGDEVVSDELYDANEIEEYITSQINDPFYPRKIALDPMGTMFEIVGIMEDLSVKQAMLDLIVKKSIVAHPEKCSGVLTTKESMQRAIERSSCIVKCLEDVKKKYLENNKEAANVAEVKDVAVAKEAAVVPAVVEKEKESFSASSRRQVYQKGDEGEQQFSSYDFIMSTMSRPEKKASQLHQAVRTQTTTTIPLPNKPEVGKVQGIQKRAEEARVNQLKRELQMVREAALKKQGREQPVEKQQKNVPALSPGKNDTPLPAPVVRPSQNREPVRVSGRSGSFEGFFPDFNFSSPFTWFGKGAQKKPTVSPSTLPPPAQVHSTYK